MRPGYLSGSVLCCRQCLDTGGWMAGKSSAGFFCKPRLVEKNPVPVISRGSLLEKVEEEVDR